ncbi:MAG: hypothetical protein GY854_34660 [Deltaproteobacteria bacterium]|nr:hypothetical protein [Deltaproteobacteria bacterium]
MIIYTPHKRELGIYANYGQDISCLPQDPVVLEQITEQLGLILMNADGVRSFETRRLCVDVLKMMQTMDAYNYLWEAKQVIIEHLATSGLTEEEQALTEDLLARLETAISPYFD